MTAFPQIVSRIGHPNPAVYSTIADLVVTILCEYPQQGLWYFTPVVHGKSAEREKRGADILARVQQVCPVAIR
jgi:serine/threonine-protein kinase ATR